MSTSTAPAADPRTFTPTTLDLGDAHLRPWSRKDVESPALVRGLTDAAADPQIALWNPLPVTDRATAAKWIGVRGDAWDAGSLATFALLDGPAAESGDVSFLGALTVRWTDRSDGLGMIGYWLLPAARGRGLATRAALVAAEWAFRTADVRRLELAHAVENEASCRVGLRAGFPAEGTLRSSFRFGDGEYHDEHLHARLASDPAPSAQG
ncbi:acetyltransferase [Streptomyces spiroverticillatus]|uniref:Acetyltransferase n=1 Tax=Streptomyces finlayi TaxID=67296 RepID=A0A919C9L9_9ACTN|nr:GNAT family protein [Streptomyces finlayi]GHA08020.1 acetyltransferase [Streptomyces spiroverticillatus]GHC91121.1 acetyltransferase [Streptomyces finlayi]